MGSVVTLRYRAGVSFLCSLHGRVGVVVVPPRGRVKNHLVIIGGRLVNVPAGHLRAAGELPS